MAKFNVGDKVTYWVFDEKVKGTIKDIRGNKAEVVQGNEKAGLTIPLKDLEAWNSCRSTNAVVANAMAANGKRVATNREIPAQTAIDYFKKLIAEMESLDKKIRPMVTRFKTLVADGNTSSMDFPDRKIVGKPEELRELDKLKDRFEELRDFAKMTMGI